MKKKPGFNENRAESEKQRHLPIWRLNLTITVKTCHE
jgi:hypothetical protein